MLAPYSGSLMRLTLTMIAILALAAVGLAYWQRAAARAPLGANSATPAAEIGIVPVARK